jgi:hypothetical protein
MKGSLAPTQSLLPKRRRKSQMFLQERLPTMSSTQPWVSVDPHNIIFLPQIFLFGEIIMFIIYQLEDSTKKKCPAHDFKHPFGIGGEIGRRKFENFENVNGRKIFRSTVELNIYRIFHKKGIKKKI